MTEITHESDLEGLTLLGKDAKPSKILEVFPNHHQSRDYTVTLTTDEFTCLCPMTGQPDFAKIIIQYIPDKSILESKSLKLYLWSYRNEGAFHEHVANTILNDLVKVLEPRWCKISAVFAVRGGIAIAVDGEYKKAVPAPPIRALPPEDRPPPARWEGGGGRSQPEREIRRSPEEKHWPAKREYRTERPEGRPPAKREYRTDRTDGRSPVKREYREKSWPPASGGERTDTAPKRSERKTTKSLGETRTWRKRI